MTSSSLSTKRVALHIGPHKTATSHLQKSLKNQRDALLQEGVRLFLPEDLRHSKPNLELLFGLHKASQKNPPKLNQAAQIAAMFGAAQRLVISEENCIGKTRKNRRPALPIYPQASQKIGALVQAMQPHPVDVFVSTRNPVGFLMSVFSQAITGGRVFDIAEFFRDDDVAAVDWAQFVQRVRATPGIGQVTVWPYEDYAALFPQICAALCGPAGEQVTPLPSKVNTGLSHAAYKDVVARYLAGETVGLAVKARKAYPVGEKWPAIPPFFSREIIAEGDAAYAQQLQQIAAMPGVTFLRPTA